MTVNMIQKFTCSDGFIPTLFIHGSKSYKREKLRQIFQKDSFFFTKQLSPEIWGTLLFKRPSQSNILGVGFLTKNLIALSPFLNRTSKFFTKNHNNIQPFTNFLLQQYDKYEMCQSFALLRRYSPLEYSRMLCMLSADIIHVGPYFSHLQQCTIHTGQVLRSKGSHYEEKLRSGKAFDQ